ncbi:hypothetical protein [Streptomyces sp. PU_AKi4]|uniref:hypothetical protein n=1 Tax=Streptomyces sp. PU_AKi4 TaxID=2800809 RepID=UPI003524CFD1
MSENVRYNDRFPTDPTQLVVLLLLAAALAGQLTPEQAGAVSAVFGFATTIGPFPPRGGR